MIITTSYYNKCREAEKAVAKKIAAVFKDEDINVFDVYAFFFNRYTPIGFDVFTRNIRKMLRTFNLSCDRVFLITYNFLPSVETFQSVISKYASGDEETIFLTALYVSFSDIYDSNFDIENYQYHIPEYIKQRFLKIDKSKFSAYYIRSMSAVSSEIRKEIGYSISDYREFKMRILRTKGILIKQTLYRFARHR